MAMREQVDFVPHFRIAQDVGIDSQPIFKVSAFCDALLSFGYVLDDNGGGCVWLF